MTAKQAYREFLQSYFWKNLSEEKRRLVGRCEDCKATKRLQSHHVRYPDDWFDTTLNDLKVLCRRCHAKTHGKPVSEPVPFMIHREDWRFSSYLHRCHCLIQKMIAGRGGLRPRDEAFLDLAEKTYPPKPKDTCMRFHVAQVRQWNVGFKEGRYQ